MEKIWGTTKSDVAIHVLGIGGITEANADLDVLGYWQ
jgi:hypothetical protein